MSGETPACPSCSVALDTMPKARRKCPSCRQWIYVKHAPGEQVHRLVTAQQAEEIGRQWEQHRLELQKIEWATRRKEADQAWGIRNAQIAEAMQKGNWHDLQQLHYAQAQQLYSEGKEFFRPLQESVRARLMSMKAERVREIQISTSGKDNTCPTCQALDGKKMSIDQALQEMPLPVSGCATAVFSVDPALASLEAYTEDMERSDGKGFCRCLYEAVERSRHG